MWRLNGKLKAYSQMHSTALKPKLSRTKAHKQKNTNKWIELMAL
jgi:hypothetical protein